MNTTPESINQLERQSFDYGYNSGIAHERGRLSPIIEDMAYLLYFCSANLPASHGSDSFKKAEAAFRKYITSTTNAA